MSDKQTQMRQLLESATLPRWSPGRQAIVVGLSLVVLSWAAEAAVDAVITKRKRLNRSLRESEEWYRTLFRQSPDSTLLIEPHTSDGVWRIVDCNDAACRMNGYAREELVGQPIDIYLPGPADPEVLAAHLARLQRMGFDRREVLHRRKDGTVFPLEASISLISLGGREMILGIDRDITERKGSDLLAHADAAASARDEFLTVVSHEMKTPLTLMKGNLQLLRLRAEQQDDAAIRKSSETVERQVDRLTRLIDDLLDVSRVGTGRMHIEMLPFDLNDVVREAVEEQAESNPAFALRLDRHAESLWVWADRGRILQVISNLLTNAIRYSADRKDIDIRTAKDGANAVVSITDYGIGIPEQQQAKVFELHFRGANAPEANSGGLGLGLYISKSIIDRHRGTIGVQSSEAAGSTFSFSLPIIGEGYA